MDKVESIKEQHCFVSLDFDATLKESQEENYKNENITMPDGSEINLNQQLFTVPEALFQPNKIEKDIMGIHEAAYQSILKCDNDIREELYNNILFSGGNTLFKGIGKRLYKELSALAPSTMKIKIKTPQERKYSPWIGGRILSTMQGFKSVWITKLEYEESGKQIIHKKGY